MKTKTIVMAVALVLAAGSVQANIIERACNRSDRSAANPRLCDCIGAAAALTLTRSDMRLASRFFRDPQRAQDVRMSESARNDAFWSRYRNFGETAEAMCS